MLLQALIVLLVVGILLWLINSYGATFIDGKILKIINVVLVIAVVVWLLKLFGVWGYLATIG